MDEKKEREMLLARLAELIQGLSTQRLRQIYLIIVHTDK